MKYAINDLKKTTKLFFELHWPKDADTTIPEWSKPWDLNSSIPNGDSPGCYVFINKDNQIIYIGVGASKSIGIYANAGIGKRVGRYKRVNKEPNSTKYRFIEIWNERNVKELRTIGFPSELGYLAYALEVFLIRKFHPQYNATNKPL